MVSTRSSTGSLPPPLKQLRLAQSDGDDVTDSYSSIYSDSVADEDKKQSVEEVVIPKSGQKLTRLERLVSSKEKGKTNEGSAGNKAKKFRKSQAGARSVGRLSLMMSMPVDIFSEVANHLDPHDLLHLARTSKALRALLMSRMARPIWRSSQKACGLPDCPPDLGINEPQLADLLFEKFCHVCGAQARAPSYYTWLRLCGACQTKNTVTGTTFCKSRKLSIPDVFFKTVLPYYISPNDDIGIFMFAFQVRREYLRPDLEDALEEFLSFGGDTEERKLFIEKRQQELVRTTTYGLKCYEWVEKRDNITRGERVSVSANRRHNIFQKLEELGYTLNDFRNDIDDKEWGWNKLLNQPRPLTERVWKNIQPKLETIISLREEKRERLRLEKNYRQREDAFLRLFAKYQERYRQKHYSKYPSIGCQDFLKTPLVASLVREDEGRVLVTRKRWALVKSELPTLITQHVKTIRNDCSNAVLKTRREQGLEKLKLASVPGTKLARKAEELASAFFFLDEYRRIDSFMTIIGRYRLSGNINTFSWRPDKAWSEYDMTSPSSVVRIADTLLGVLNLPKAVSMEHMESLGKRFRCNRCDPLFQNLMTWKELVNHYYYRNEHCTTIQEGVERLLLKDPSQSFAIINIHKLDNDSPDVGTASLDESSIAGDGVAVTHISSNRDYDCKLCSALFVSNVHRNWSWEHVKAHMRDFHGKYSVRPGDVRALSSKSRFTSDSD